MQVMLKYTAWAAGLYIAYLGLLYLLARPMIFPRGQTGVPPHGGAHDNRVIKQWVRTSAGRVETWFLPPEKTRADRPAPAVIFGHGNAELIDYCASEFQPLTENGFAVLLVEYPGYGRSEGSPSQASITEAFCAAYDMLLERQRVDPDRIILFGRSLGGGAVCALAAKRECAAIILVSSFTSIRSFAARFLVPGFLVRDPFDNLAVVGAFAGPILIIHGSRDEIIPYRHALALHRASANSRLITYACSHNDCPPQWGPYWRDVLSFLRANQLHPYEPPAGPTGTDPPAREWSSPGKRGW
jgi:pimeloyl-ACP methyl ester carboxylesterase